MIGFPVALPVLRSLFCRSSAHPERRSLLMPATDSAVAFEVSRSGGLEDMPVTPDGPRILTMPNPPPLFKHLQVLDRTQVDDGGACLGKSCYIYFMNIL